MLESLKAGENEVRGTLSEVVLGLAAAIQAAITSKCIHGKVQLLAPGKGERAKTAAAPVKRSQRTLVISLDGTELQYYNIY